MEIEFMPHGNCFMWTPDILLMYVVGGLMTAGAYFTIPAFMVSFAKRRPDIPFRWMWFMFGAFIVLCAIGHVIGVWNLWYANYRLGAAVQLLTGFVSVATAAAMPRVMKFAMLIPSPEQLVDINKTLAEELENSKTKKGES